jgi:hypothetical protein
VRARPEYRRHGAVSLLRRGTETVAVYPEEATIDEDGNTITRPSNVDVVASAVLQPITPAVAVRRRRVVGDRVRDGEQPPAAADRLARRLARGLEPDRLEGYPVRHQWRAEDLQRIPAHGTSTTSSSASDPRIPKRRGDGAQSRTPPPRTATTPSCRRAS